LAAATSIKGAGVTPGLCYTPCSWGAICALAKFNLIFAGYRKRPALLGPPFILVQLVFNLFSSCGELDRGCRYNAVALAGIV